MHQPGTAAGTEGKRIDISTGCKDATEAGVEGSAGEGGEDASLPNYRSRRTTFSYFLTDRTPAKKNESHQ